MKTLPLHLALTLLGTLSAVSPVIAASFSGQLSNVTLKLNFSQLSLIDFDNVGGENSYLPQLTTTGTGTAQGNSTSSTFWEIDPSSLSFLELNYDGGNISGQSGLQGFASAVVSGNSNKLAITNQSTSEQNLTIQGNYSVNLNTQIGDTLFESAQAGFTLKVMREPGTIVNSFSQLISGNNSFSETKNFTVSLNIQAGETVFITSDLSGQAQAQAVPEPSLTILGIGVILGALPLLKKRMKITRL